MKTILLMLTTCFLFSFTIPTREQFSIMNNGERADCLTDVWKHRYDIMLKSDSTDVVSEFFTMYHEMLLLDKDMCHLEDLE